MLSQTWTNFFYIKSFFLKHLLNETNFFILYFNNFFAYKLICLPTKIKKFTVVKSPFVSKLSREQFEFRVYKVLLKLNFFNFIFLKSTLYILLSFFKNSYINYRLKIVCI